MVIRAIVAIKLIMAITGIKDSMAIMAVMATTTIINIKSKYLNLNRFISMIRYDIDIFIPIVHCFGKFHYYYFD